MPKKELHPNTKVLYMWTNDDIAEAAGVSSETLQEHIDSEFLDPSAPLSIAFYLARFGPKAARHHIVDCALGTVLPNPEMWKKKTKTKRLHGKTHIMSVTDVAEYCGMPLTTAHQHRKRGSLDGNYLFCWPCFFAKYGSRKVRHTLLDCAFGEDPTPEMWRIKQKVNKAK